MPAGHGVLGDMAVGVWAQLVAGVVYTPIDIVKERLQVPLSRRSATLASCAVSVCVGRVRVVGYGRSSFDCS